MLQQVTTEVQLRLAAQVNGAVSLDRTRLGSITFSHQFSIHDKAHLPHLWLKKLQARAIFVKQYSQPDFIKNIEKRQL